LLQDHFPFPSFCFSIDFPTSSGSSTVSVLRTLSPGFMFQSLHQLFHFLQRLHPHGHSSGLAPLLEFVHLQFCWLLAWPFHFDLDVPAAVTRRDVRRPGAAVRAAVVVSRSAAGEAV